MTEELIAGLGLASGASLNIAASTLEVSGSGLAAIGGVGSTIEIAGGQLTVDSAVTSASGAVNVIGGGYIYSGSGSTQTVTVSGGGLFDVDGSNNSSTVNLSGSGKLFLDSTGNHLDVNMSGGQLEVESTGNTGTVNLLGNGQLIFYGAVAFNGTLGELGAGHTLEVENQGAETAHSFSTDTANNSITLDFTAGSTTLSYTLNFDPTTESAVEPDRDDIEWRFQHHGRGHRLFCDRLADQHRSRRSCGRRAESWRSGRDIGWRGTADRLDRPAFHPQPGPLTMAGAGSGWRLWSGGAKA